MQASRDEFIYHRNVLIAPMRGASKYLIDPQTIIEEK